MRKDDPESFQNRKQQITQRSRDLGTQQTLPAGTLDPATAESLGKWEAKPVPLPCAEGQDHKTTPAGPPSPGELAPRTWGCDGSRGVRAGKEERGSGAGGQERPAEQRSGSQESGPGGMTKRMTC